MKKTLVSYLAPVVAVMGISLFGSCEKRSVNNGREGLETVVEFNGKSDLEKEINSGDKEIPKITVTIEEKIDFETQDFYVRDFIERVKKANKHYEVIPFVDEINPDEGDKETLQKILTLDQDYFNKTFVTYADFLDSLENNKTCLDYPDQMMGLFIWKLIKDKQEAHEVCSDYDSFMKFYNVNADKKNTQLSALDIEKIIVGTELEHEGTEDIDISQLLDRYKKQLVINPEEYNFKNKPLERLLCYYSLTNDLSEQEIQEESLKFWIQYNNAIYLGAVYRTKLQKLDAIGGELKSMFEGFFKK